MNGVGPIREATKQKVLDVAKALNYYPHAIAQSFARRRSGNLGIVLPYVPKVHVFSTYYFAEILSGIGDEVRNHGYDLLLFMISRQEPIDYVKLVQSQKVDACLILGAQDTMEQRTSLLALERLNLPFCLINQRFDGLGFHEVDANHERGSQMATEHFVAHGHRNIAFINGSSGYSNSKDRAKGYKTAMELAELEVNQHLQFTGNYSRKSGYLLAPHIWEKRKEIDAVFVANDRMAIGLMQGLHELDSRSQTRIPMIGCDDSDAAKLHQPPLSSIHVPFFEMGQVATQQVMNQLKNGKSQASRCTMLDTHLVIRESSQRK